MANFEQPNGIQFSPDGTTLYVSDTSRAIGGAAHEILAFKLAIDRPLRARVGHSACLRRSTKADFLIGHSKPTGECLTVETTAPMMPTFGSFTFPAKTEAHSSRTRPPYQRIGQVGRRLWSSSLSRAHDGWDVDVAE